MPAPTELQRTFGTKFEALLAISGPCCFALLAYVMMVSTWGRDAGVAALPISLVFIVLGIPLALLVYHLNRPSVTLEGDHVVVEPSHGMMRRVVPLRGARYHIADRELTLRLFPLRSSWKTAGAFPHRMRVRLDEESGKMWRAALSEHGAIEQT